MKLHTHASLYFYVLLNFISFGISAQDFDIASLHMAHDNIVQDKTYYSIKQLKLQAKQGDSSAMNHLGVLSLAIENYAEAITWFKKALTVKPYDSIYNGNLGQAYYCSGEFLMAEKHLKLSAEKGQPGAMVLLAQFALEQEDYEQACTWYQKALERKDDDRYKLGLAYAYYSSGNTDAAKELYEGLAYKKNVTALLCLADIAIKDRNMQQALSWLIKAANITRRPDIFMQIAQLYELMDDTQQALVWYKRAALKGEPEAAYKLGCKAFYSNRYQQAIKWLSKAVKYDEQNITYTESLAYAHQLKGNRIKSQQYYKKANQLKADQ